MMLRILQPKEIHQAPFIVVFPDVASFSAQARLKEVMGNGGLAVVVSEFSSQTIRDSNLRRQAESNVRQFSWHLFPYAKRMQSHDQAYDLVENVYAVQKREGVVPVSPFLRMYGDEKIQLIFKKNLIIELQAFFDVCEAAQNLLESNPKVQIEGTRDWLNMYNWVRSAHTDFSLANELVSSEQHQSLKTSFYDGLDRTKKWWKSVLRIAVIPAYSLLKIRRIVIGRKEDETVEIVHRLYNSDLGLKKVGQGIDWLIDGKSINKNNILYVADDELSADYKEKLADRRLRYVSFQRSKAFANVTLHQILSNLIVRNAALFFPVLFFLLRSERYYHEGVFTAWIEYLRWTTFLGLWKPKSYVSNNDLGITHIPRNIILMKSGCICSMYYHSNGNAQLYEYKKSYSGRLVQWSYLFYDREYHWGRQQAQLSQESLSSTREQIACGPLWVSNTHKNNDLSDLMDSMWPEDNRKIVSFFNSSFGSAKVQNAEKDHLEFLRAIVMLLNHPEHKNIRGIFKPKYPFGLFVEKGGDEIASVAQQLIDDPRMLILEPKRFASIDVLAASNLVVSMPFSSPSTEAFAAGKKGIYLDACNSYPHSYFDRFPQMVAHSKSAFLDLVSLWMEMEDSDVEAYRQTYIEPEFGGVEGQSAMFYIRKDLFRI